MYMTKDFAKTQVRKFNVYPIGVFTEPDTDEIERKKQAIEHKVREANAKKNKKDK